MHEIFIKSMTVFLQAFLRDYKSVFPLPRTPSQLFGGCFLNTINAFLPMCQLEEQTSSLEIFARSEETGTDPSRTIHVLNRLLLAGTRARPGTFGGQRGGFKFRARARFSSRVQRSGPI